MRVSASDLPGLSPAMSVTVEVCPLIDGRVRVIVANAGGLWEAGSAVNRAAGVRSSRMILGRLLSSFSTARRCSAQWVPRSVPLGK